MISPGNWVPDTDAPNQLVADYNQQVGGVNGAQSRIASGAQTRVVAPTQQMQSAPPTMNAEQKAANDLRRQEFRGEFDTAMSNYNSSIGKYSPTQAQYSNTASDADLQNYRNQEIESQKLAAGGAERASWQQQTNLTENQMANKLAQQNIDAVARSQQFNPENTQNLGYKGDLNNYGDFSRSAITETPQRLQELASVGPDSRNPMVPVSSSGGNIVQPISGSTVAPTPIINTGNVSNQGPTSTMVPSGGQNLSDMQGGYDIAGALPFTAEDYINATPEQQAQMKQMAFNQQAQMQMQGQNQVYGAQDQMLAQQQTQAQQDLAARKAELEAQKAKEEADYIAAQTAAKDQALASVQKAAERRKEQLNESMSFQGFGRSSVAAELNQDIAGDTQAQIADIERQTNQAISQYKASALDKMNSQLSSLQDRVDKYGNARDQVKLESIKGQSELMQSLFKQSPSNPENMIKAAEDLQKTRIEQRKMDLAELKEVRDSAKDNFQFMVSNFGSSYINNLDQESLNTLAHNMGVPSSALSNIGKTQKEQDREWEAMKYVQDRNYDVAKTQSQQQFQMAMSDQNFKRDLQKIGIEFDNNLQMQGFKDKLASQKYANLGYGDYAGVATGIVNNGAGLMLENGGQVSPQLKNAAVPGSKKAAGSNGLGGQCAYEAGNMVSPPGSTGRMNYGMNLQDKMKNLKSYVSKGQAFLGANGQAKVGNSVITNESKQWGHVAVINEILPNGDYVLTEYNRTGPLQFSNSRVVKKDAPFIQGVIDTKPQKNYQVAKDINSLAADAAKRDPLMKGGAAVFGQTSLGKLTQLVGSAFSQEASRQEKGFLTDEQSMLPEDQRVQVQAPQAAKPVELTPFRKAVQAGTMKLPDSQLNEMLQSNPAAYQQYMEDLSVGSTKSGAGQLSGWEKVGKLPVTAQDSVAKSISVLQGLKGMQDAMMKGGESSIRGVESIPFIRGANEFEINRNLAIENVGRLQSGGAISPDEFNNFKNLLPKYEDSNEIRSQKLQMANNFIENKLRVYGLSGSDLMGQAQQQAGGKVRVQMNGQTYEIDQSDLQAALSEGAKQI